MFTGIIKGIGHVVAIQRQAETAKLTISSPLFTEINPQLGDSFAINGICLTATGVADKQLSVEVMPETTRLTNLGQLKTGELVNLEPALGATARLDGHFVLGHVDTTAELVQRVEDQNATVLTFKIAPEYDDYIVKKGSIAIDGVSLTVTQAGPGQFSVSLIPYTQNQTTLGSRQVGDLVNIETDVLGKYIVGAQRKEAVQ
ncbi:riboflavin synthase [Lactobacillus sp. LC28-10]|uniref:Riboflavin synthase n=1 Tax=Secundilactobacillus angelensis TaxID=2722706 RepID=A0ABX1KVP2_9LACO|nr:riboflavin synthase [Secundilactobacillus angelensis]MCH5461860.1 riboflavin synthase [Secundilactobacillus angelensis]NLR17347.1 riboflavin synthase [Secundilactobacillus angelensis]